MMKAKQAFFSKKRRQINILSTSGRNHYVKERFVFFKGLSNGYGFRI